MLRIESITQDPLQRRTLILPDLTQVVLEMYFVPQQYGWFITYLEYQDFVLTNLRITNQPNMLRQWKNILPFGLACFSKQDREPTQQQDFSSENSKLFILTDAEVQEYEAFLNG